MRTRLSTYHGRPRWTGIYWSLGATLVRVHPLSNLSYSVEEFAVVQKNEGRSGAEPKPSALTDTEARASILARAVLLHQTIDLRCHGQSQDSSPEAEASEGEHVVHLLHITGWYLWERESNSSRRGAA